MNYGFLFKEIEIENFRYIVEQFKSVADRYRSNNQFYFNHVDRDSFLKDCDLVKKYFDENKCEISVVATIEIPPRSQCNLHIDSQIISSLAMNFPVFNCDDSYTAMYKIINGSPSSKKLSSGLSATSFDDCDAAEISRYYLKDKAVIFNTQVPHCVFNNSDKLRYAISFRFKKDPWHLLK
jgi:hypothetical protein